MISKVLTAVYLFSVVTNADSYRISDDSDLQLRSDGSSGRQLRSAGGSGGRSSGTSGTGTSTTGTYSGTSGTGTSTTGTYSGTSGTETSTARSYDGTSGTGQATTGTTYSGTSGSGASTTGTTATGSSDEDNGWEDWWSNEDDYEKDHEYKEGEEECDYNAFDCEYVDCDWDEMIEPYGCWKELCVCTTRGDDTCDLWHYDYETEEWFTEFCYEDTYNDDQNGDDDMGIQSILKLARLARGFNDTIEFALDDWCPNFDCITNATANFIDENDITELVNQGLSQRNSTEYETISGDAEDSFDINLSDFDEIKNATQVQQIVDHALGNIQDDSEGLVAGFLNAFREGFENLGDTRKGGRN